MFLGYLPEAGKMKYVHHNRNEFCMGLTDEIRQLPLCI
jgi:hypothetical protein